MFSAEGAPMVGKTVAHYRILEKLGEGGMGVVYRAEDLTLTRTVALKFLPEGLHEEVERTRFLQEARAAAILNHPNICTIYDILEQDGRPFIVMECVEGKTLREVAPMENIQNAISCALQIGEALQEAHSHGIVHRDVKADNIMLNTKGQVKVMDFGLAKLKGTLKLTRTSSTVGTLAYMAPEQLQGAGADARSDIFSLGVVLFELLTGRLPFHGEHEAALMYSILNEGPDALLKYRPDAPPDLERIIQRALEKDPEDRYQHVGDMTGELHRLQRHLTRPAPVSLAGGRVSDPSMTSSSLGEGGGATIPSSRNRWGLQVAGVLAVLIVLAVVSYLFVFTPNKAIDSLAVLPFANTSGDPNTDYLSDGITESLINGLSGLSNLRVMSRSSVFHFRDKNPDPQAAGKELGVKAVLTGSITERGKDLLISTELVDVANNSHLWGERYNRPLSGILSVEDEIAREISRKLRITLAGEEEKKLAKHSTDNTEAYQLYLKGNFHWNKRTSEDLRRAIDYYNQAIGLDPNYALAYAGLAWTYVVMPEYAGVPVDDVQPKAEAAARKAIELDPTLAQPHAVLGLVQEISGWDWSAAESEFKKAIELNPGFPIAHHWYSMWLRYRGDLDGAMREAKKAQELDPLSVVVNWNVGDILFWMGQDDKAIGQYKATLELDPNQTGVMTAMGLVYTALGRYDEAVADHQKVRAIVGDSPFGLSELGYAYARAGRKGEAMTVLHELLKFSEQGYSLSYDIAFVYHGLGDKEKTFEWLEKAYRDKHYRLSEAKTSPHWEGLRHDPRFIALMKKIGLD